MLGFWRIFSLFVSAAVYWLGGWVVIVSISYTVCQGVEIQLGHSNLVAVSHSAWQNEKGAKTGCPNVNMLWLDELLDICYFLEDWYVAQKIWNSTVVKITYDVECEVKHKIQFSSPIYLSIFRPGWTSILSESISLLTAAISQRVFALCSKMSLNFVTMGWVSVYDTIGLKPAASMKIFF